MRDRIAYSKHEDCDKKVKDKIAIIRLDSSKKWKDRMTKGEIKKKYGWISIELSNFKDNVIKDKGSKSVQESSKRGDYAYRMSNNH